MSAPIQSNNGTSHQRCHYRHDDEAGKKALGNDSALEPDINNDQFHQPPRVHERANAERLPVRNASGPGRQPAGSPLPNNRGGENSAADQPEKARVEQTNFSLKAGIGKVERQKQGNGQRLNPIANVAGDDRREASRPPSRKPPEPRADR